MEESQIPANRDEYMSILVAQNDIDYRVGCVVTVHTKVLRINRESTAIDRTTSPRWIASPYDAPVFPPSICVLILFRAFRSYAF